MRVVSPTYPMLDRNVALKVLGELGDNAEFRERFYREARATARLQHRNIVTIFEFGEEREQLFIAMEYLSGIPLSKLIRRRDTTSLERRLAIILDVCAGLGYAHEQGLVHRDVKPGNVILLDDGTAKLLDFGTALLGTASQLTIAGTVVGTIGYLAPEMARGEAVDRRADIFAVGTMLYELLTWQRPFDGGGSIAAALAQIVHEDPPPPSSLVPALPAALDAIVERCLRKNPDDRYQDLDALARDLVRFRASQSPAALADDPRVDDHSRYIEANIFGLPAVARGAKANQAMSATRTGTRPVSTRAQRHAALTRMTTTATIIITVSPLLR